MANAAPPPAARSPAAAVSMVQNSPAAAPPPVYHQPRAPLTPSYQQAFPNRTGSFAPQTPHAAVYQAPALPHQYAAPQHSPYPAYAGQRLPAGSPAVYNFNAPRPIETFHLSDAANAAIPADIREQFHRDDQGHVLFFSTPPLDIVPPVEQRLGHSLKYLAAKEERQKLIEEKKRKDVSERAEHQRAEKRQWVDEQDALARKVQRLTEDAIRILSDGIASGTDKFYKDWYGDKAEEAKLANIKKREQQILKERLSQEQTTEILTQSQKRAFVSLKGSAFYLDDVNPQI